MFLLLLLDLLHPPKYLFKIVEQDSENGKEQKLLLPKARYKTTSIGHKMIKKYMKGMYVLNHELERKMQGKKDM
jgi:hypothetical protein